MPAVLADLVAVGGLAAAAAVHVVVVPVERSGFAAVLCWWDVCKADPTSLQGTAA